MIRVRSGRDRGHFDHGWLDTFHTFSFGDYVDPAHVRFRALRVINEDRVAPGTGFGMHPHRDMEILTHVRDGALAHRDSLGHGSVLRAGQWQRMTAGTGILHSEANPSASDPVHLFQIWIFPDRKGLQPSYEQTENAPIPAPGHWVHVAAPHGGDALVSIHQDARVLHGAVGEGAPLTLDLAPGRHAWLQVMAGSVTFNRGTVLDAGDAAALSDEPTLRLDASERAEVLLFDLA